MVFSSCIKTTQILAAGSVLEEGYYFIIKSSISGVSEPKKNPL